jgi:hypothetical protein
MQWQPMKTSPKDGTVILLRLRPSSSGAPQHCFSARWDEQDQDWYASEISAGFKWDEPVAWMPLPSGPVRSIWRPIAEWTRDEAGDGDILGCIPWSSEGRSGYARVILTYDHCEPPHRCWISDSGQRLRPAYWMPLPPPPTGQGGPKGSREAALHPTDPKEGNHAD